MHESFSAAAENRNQLSTAHTGAIFYSLFMERNATINANDSKNVRHKLQLSICREQWTSSSTIACG
jgi:hypothetical protein